MKWIRAGDKYYNLDHVRQIALGRNDKGAVDYVALYWQNDDQATIWYASPGTEGYDEVRQGIASLLQGMYDAEMDVRDVAGVIRWREE
jgi:hypothetical protein